MRQLNTVIKLLDRVSNVAVSIATGSMIVILLLLAFHIAANDDFMAISEVKWTFCILFFLYVMYLIGQGFEDK